MLSGDEVRKILEAVDELELPAELRAEEEEEEESLDYQEGRGKTDMNVDVSEEG